MIRDVYRSYFQKSHTFLFPLLGIPKNYGTINKIPRRTYITLKDVFGTEDRKLIAVYNISSDKIWSAYREKVLMKHAAFENSFVINDEEVFIFDMSKYEDDYKQFLSGSYSKYSPQAKKAISIYYGIHTPEWAYIESFLFPEKYFKDYAEILSIDEKILKDVGELCDKYDVEKENLILDIGEDVLKILTLKTAVKNHV